MIKVTNLQIYPVKSMQGINLSEATVLPTGFKYDRILMITEPNGTFITAREYPILLTLKTAIIDDTVQIISSSQSIFINFDEFSPMREPTEVWGNHFTSQIAPIRVNRFLSELLQRDVQLRWIGQSSTRTIKRYPDIPLSFADGHPYLLLNRASFNYLQSQCPEKLNIDQFRGNIIIDGALPFAEDGWKTIKIGDVLFDLIKPCSRCVMITMDKERVLADNEPLKTLRRFRTDEQGEIDFGIKMIARNLGRISINDKIEIIEHKPAKHYLSLSKDEQCQTTTSKTVTITFGDHRFDGNDQQPILEQLEQANIRIPYSCRAGICGRCQLRLISGEVKGLTQSAIKPNQTILTCSCIPQSDIALTTIKP